MEKSVRKLYSHYLEGEDKALQLTINQHYDALYNFVNSLPEAGLLQDDLKKLKAAKRCMQEFNIPEGDGIVPLDRKDLPDISLKTVMSLVWMALQDEEEHLKKHYPQKEDFAAVLSEIMTNALYEIKRGYNLSPEGKDDDDINDKTICPGGIVNNFVYLLQGRHSQVEITLVSKETIQQKAFAIMNTSFTRYFNQLSQEKKPLYTNKPWSALSLEEKLGKDYAKEQERIRQALLEECAAYFEDEAEQRLYLGNECLAKVVNDFVDNLDYYVPEWIQKRENGTFSPSP